MANSFLRGPRYSCSSVEMGRKKRTAAEDIREAVILELGVDRSRDTLIARVLNRLHTSGKVRQKEKFSTFKENALVNLHKKIRKYATEIANSHSVALGPRAALSPRQGLTQGEEQIPDTSVSPDAAHNVAATLRPGAESSASLDIIPSTASLDAALHAGNGLRRTVDINPREEESRSDETSIPTTPLSSSVDPDPNCIPNSALNLGAADSPDHTPIDNLSRGPDQIPSTSVSPDAAHNAGATLSPGAESSASLESFPSTASLDAALHAGNGLRRTVDINPREEESRSDETSIPTTPLSSSVDPDPNCIPNSALNLGAADSPDHTPIDNLSRGPDQIPSTSVSPDAAHNAGATRSPGAESSASLEIFPSTASLDAALHAGNGLRRTDDINPREEESISDKTSIPSTPLSSRVDPDPNCMPNSALNLGAADSPDHTPIDGLSRGPDLIPGAADSRCTANIPITPLSGSPPFQGVQDELPCQPTDGDETFGRQRQRELNLTQPNSPASLASSSPMKLFPSDVITEKSDHEEDHLISVRGPKRRLRIESLDSCDEDDPVCRRCTKFDKTKAVQLFNFSMKMLMFVDDYARRNKIKRTLCEYGHFCVLRFKTKNVHRLGNSFVEYALCTHDDCRHYRFDSLIDKNGHTMTCSVSYCGPDVLNHIGPARAYQLRGEERKELKRQLLEVKPSIIRDSHVLEADEHAIESGNMQSIRSSEVYRKARSEAHAEGDYHSNPVMDFILRAQSGSEKGYVQYPKGSTHIKMYSKEQAEVVLQSTEKVLHLDSTGSLVEQGVYDEKRVYYYAAVVRCCGKLLPALEMVTSSHSAADIGCWLLEYRHFLQVLKLNDSPFTDVVVDCSYAMILGVCSGWVGVKPSIYLQMCVQSIAKKTEFPFPRIRLCCAHFMHMVSRKLRKLETDSKKRHYYCSSVAILIECTDWAKFKQLFRAVAILCLSRYESDLTQAAREVLSPFANTEDFPEMDDSPEEKEQNYAKDQFADKLITDSPFHVVFARLSAGVEAEIEEASSSKSLNNLSCPEFLKYLLRYHMALVPMWSGLLLHNSTVPSVRLSNAPVESWFKTVKNEVHQGRTRMRPGRFIEPVHRKIKATVKSIKLSTSFPQVRTGRKAAIKRSCTEADLPESATAKRLKKSSGMKSSKRKLFDDGEKAAGDLTQEEFWLKKTPSQKQGYFDSPFARKLLKSAASPSSQTPTTPPRHATTHAPANSSLPYTFIPDGTYKSEMELIDTYMHAAVSNQFFNVAVYHSKKYPHVSQRLSSRDFATLITDKQVKCFGLSHYDPGKDSPRMWVADTVLDYFGYEIFDRHQSYTYIDSLVVQFRDFEIIKDSLKSRKIVVFNLLLNDHWVTVAMSAANKQVHIFSSTISNAVQDVKMWMCPEDSKSLTDLDQWTFLQPRAFVQADAYSCGVAAIFFMLSISKCEQLAQCNPNDLEPESYREKLQLYIATNARREGVVEKCAKCFMKSPATLQQKQAVNPSGSEKPKSVKPSAPILNWVQCDGCDAWFHVDCLNGSVEYEKETFYCFFCESRTRQSE